MKKEVLILFTMDVEPVSSGKNSTGPQSDSEGAVRVKEYMDVLADYGYTPTFFIHPELGETQAEMFLELQEKGACLGLHIHASKFTAKKYDTELGALSFAEQKEIIGMGMQMFEKYFGFKPEIFRPGCFSANDYTYAVLDELGFRGGSICIPGRIWLDKYCVWSGAYPHPHYANSNIRQAKGDLPFVEIPLSVDMSRLIKHPLGFDHYFDLRPGDVYTNENIIPRDHAEVLANIVKQLADDDPILKTIVIDVHNDRNFKDLSTEPAKQLKTVLDNIRPELKKYRFIPENGTYYKAIDKFRKAE